MGRWPLAEPSKKGKKGWENSRNKKWGNETAVAEEEDFSLLRVQE
jgi:hypothetical protein